MKIGIVGAGALGLTFAAALAARHDVLVLARRPAVATQLARDGIGIVTDEGTAFVRVGATVDPVRLADRDALIVAVKSYATAEALAPLRGLLPAHALIASIQNGIDNADVARATLPGARVVAGSTMQGGLSQGEGRVRPIGRGTTIFARDASASPTSDELAAAFTSCWLPAQVVDDIAPVLWRKLVINAAINPLGALAGRTNGDVVTDPDLAPMARRLAAEAAAVAAAEGIDVDDPWGTVEAAGRSTAANRNSMLQDLDAGRQTEIEAISGAIVRRAHSRGIAAPLTATVLGLIRARSRA